MHRAGQETWLQSTHRLDRRRRKLPGQQHFRKTLENYLESMREIYKALPDDWRILSNTSFMSPLLFNSYQRLGTSYYCARELGPKALVW